MARQYDDQQQRMIAEQRRRERRENIVVTVLALGLLFGLAYWGARGGVSVL